MSNCAFCRYWEAEYVLYGGNTVKEKKFIY